MQTLMQIKNKLPLDFINELYRTYNERVANKILTGMEGNRLTTLRVNSIKYNIESLIKYLENNNIQFEKVSWYKDSLIIKNVNEKDIEKLDIYQNGFIYVQSLSSMIPPIVLRPKPGEKVLDLTAAPGSKTTQIAAMMKNEGYILANELDKIRYDRLKYNVKTQGAEIVETINKNGENIGNEFTQLFDKVLLDTPCSGEGRFSITNTNTYKNWSLKQIEELTKLQKKLFESAVKALKNEGELVYSTCTLNKRENEEIVNWAIKNFDLELLDININIKNSIKVLNKALKILPSKELEGFFIAKLKKK